VFEDPMQDNDDDDEEEEEDDEEGAGMDPAKVSSRRSCVASQSSTVSMVQQLALVQRSAQDVARSEGCKSSSCTRSSRHVFDSRQSLGFWWKGWRRKRK
jgi:hypothetical protein